MLLQRGASHIDIIRDKQQKKQYRTDNDLKEKLWTRIMKAASEESWTSLFIPG